MNKQYCKTFLSLTSIASFENFKMNCVVLIVLFALCNYANGNVAKHLKYPSSLKTCSTAQLFALQRKMISYNEPIVNYSKLQNGTLELQGSEFTDETERKLEFIAYLLSYFHIESLAFKNFGVSQPLQKILSYFTLKCSIAIKSVSFDHCSIFGHFSPSEIVTFKNVQKLEFTKCTTNERELNLFFSLFSNQIAVLTLDNFTKMLPVDIEYSSKMTELDPTSINISLLSLDNFSNVKHISLNGDFCLVNADFGMFNQLKSLVLNHSSFFAPPDAFLNSLPSTVKRIKSNSSENYIRNLSKLNFVDKKIVIESSPVYIHGGLLKCPEFLLVFTSFSINFNELNNDSAVNFFEFLLKNKSNLSHITTVSVTISVTCRHWNQLLQLIELMPGLKSLVLNLRVASEESIPLSFPSSAVTAIKELKISFPFFKNDDETRIITENNMSSIVRYLLTLTPHLKSLEFCYYGSNTFMDILVHCESFPSIQLDKFTVKYKTNSTIFIQIELNLCQIFNAEQLEINTCLYFKIVGTATDLNAMQNLSIKKLTLNLFEPPNHLMKFLTKLIEKVPYVEELHVMSVSYKLLTKSNLLKLPYLRKITIAKECTLAEERRLCKILPSTIQAIEFQSYSYCKEVTLNIFREKFLNAMIAFKNS